MRFQSNGEVTVREEEDGMHLAFNAETGVGIILNRTAHFIWARAVEGCLTEDITRQLLESFEFDTATSESELSEVVSGHVRLLQQTRLLIPLE